VWREAASRTGIDTHSLKLHLFVRCRKRRMLWDAKMLRELASKDVVENYQTQDTKKAQSREALGGKLDKKNC